MHYIFVYHVSVYPFVFLTLVTTSLPPIGPVNNVAATWASWYKGKACNYEKQERGHTWCSCVSHSLSLIFESCLPQRSISKFNI